MPVAGAVLAGVFAAREGLEAPAWGVAAMGAVALVGVALAAVARRRREEESSASRVVIAALLIAVGLLACLRAARIPTVVPGGILLREACVGDATRSRDARSFLSDAVAAGDGEAAFRARLVLPARPGTAAPRAGDRVRFRGAWRPPAAPQNPGEADGRFALGTVRAEEGWRVVGRCGPAPAAWLAGARARMRGAAEEFLSPGNAGLAIALTTGSEDAILPEDLAAFRETGAIHVLVIAGLHLALVAAAVFAIARGLALRIAPRIFEARDVRPLAAAASFGAALLYAALAGFRLSTRRALGATALGSLAILRGGAAEAWNALAAAAIGLLLADPEAVTAPAFVLGFLAVGGILAAGPADAISHEVSRGTRAWLRAAGAARTTVAAAVATAPALAVMFGRVPLCGAAANLAAVPLAGAALVPLLGAAAWPQATPWLLPLAGPPLALARGVVGAAAMLPLASARLWLPPLAAAAGCAGVFAGRLLRGRARRAAVGCAVAVAVGVGCRPYAAPPRLTVTFLAVGQGDAAVVRTSSGEVILIDGGPEGAGRRVVVPYLHSIGVRRLDAIVVSHAHPDHTGGLSEVAEAFSTREIWTAGPVGADPALARLLARASRDGTRLRVPDRGEILVRGALRIEILGPVAEPREELRWEGTHRNDRSLVLRLAEEGSPSFLFPGDVEFAGEMPLVERSAGDAESLRADVVKIAHHGSATSSAEAFVRGTRARLAIVEAGRENRFGFPSPKVVERWQRAGAEVRQTPEEGAFEVASCDPPAADSVEKSAICVRSGVDTISTVRLVWIDGSPRSDPGRRR